MLMRAMDVRVEEEHCAVSLTEGTLARQRGEQVAIAAEQHSDDHDVHIAPGRDDDAQVPRPSTPPIERRPGQDISSEREKSEEGHDNKRGAVTGSLVDPRPPKKPKPTREHDQHVSAMADQFSPIQSPGPSSQSNNSTNGAK